MLALFAGGVIAHAQLQETPQDPTPPAGATPPSIISKSDPVYSPVAQKLHVQGSVLLSIVVNQHGMAEQIRVIRGLGYGLDRQAVEAVIKWRFRPGAIQGTPVKARAQVQVNFRPLAKGQPDDDRWSAGQMLFPIDSTTTWPEVTDGTMTSAIEDSSNESVVLEFTVNPDGTVKNGILVVHGSQSSGQLMADCLSTWRFRPAMKNGQAVEATGRVRFIRGQGDDDAKLALSLGDPSMAH